MIAARAFGDLEGARRVRTDVNLRRVLAQTPGCILPPTPVNGVHVSSRRKRSKLRCPRVSLAVKRREMERERERERKRER